MSRLSRRVAVMWAGISLSCACILAVQVAWSCQLKKTWSVDDSFTVTINQPQYGAKFPCGAEVPCSGWATDKDRWTTEDGGGDTADDSIAWYAWEAGGGTWKNGVSTGANVTWIAPDTAGLYAITLTADDVDGLPAGDEGNRNDPPGSVQVVVAVCPHAHPTNFRQTIGTKGIGVLSFRYVWDSTSGNKADLAGVEMGEYVSYQGWPEPSFWFPDPPFHEWGQANPYKMTFPPTDDYVDDVHPPFGGFSTPYCNSTVTARQIFYFHCPTCMTEPTQAFPLAGTIYIPRCVKQVNGAWIYTVSKSGLESDPLPLP